VREDIENDYLKKRARIKNEIKLNPAINSK
jgi:hypothetical protein